MPGAVLLPAGAGVASESLCAFFVEEAVVVGLFEGVVVAFWGSIQ